MSRLPGLGGLELQRRLAGRTDMPIVFITGHGDVPTTVQAMKAGAFDFLTKPLEHDVLLARHPSRARAEPRRAAPRVGDAGAADVLRVADAGANAT